MITMRVKYLREAALAAFETGCPDCGRDVTPAGPCKHCRGRGSTSCECVDCGDEHTRECPECDGEALQGSWCDWCQEEREDAPIFVTIGPGEVDADELLKLMSKYPDDAKISVDWFAKADVFARLIFRFTDPAGLELEISAARLAA